MRLFMMMSCVLLLGACSTVKEYFSFDKPSCYERVAIIEMGIDRAYKSVGDLVRDDFISPDDALEAVEAIDSANAAVDSASPLCSIDKAAATDYLDIARDFLDRVTEITTEQE